MKCAVVFLSLIALTFAYPFTFGEGKQVTIDKDGTISILGENGKKIVISKAIGHPGPKDIEISVAGPEGLVKKISVDADTNTKRIDLIEPVNADYYNVENEDREKRSSKDSKNSKYSKDSKEQKYKSQSELLTEIFKEYQGIVDKKSYDDLLNRINSYVESGELNEAVYDVLRSLDEFKHFEKLGYHSQPQVKAQEPVKHYPVNYYPEEPVKHYPVNYYPVNNYPYRQEYYPYLHQQQEYYPSLRQQQEFYPSLRKQEENYPYYGYEHNNVAYPEEFEGVQGVRNIFSQPRGQIYEQSREELPGFHQYKPFEQEYYQKQYQKPQQSVLKPSSLWFSNLQNEQDKPYYISRSVQY